jgi:hypothetical protein
MAAIRAKAGRSSARHRVNRPSAFFKRLGVNLNALKPNDDIACIILAQNTNYVCKIHFILI